MQQLTIFDALDEIAAQNGRRTFKYDIMQLIEKRLHEMGIAEHFILKDTKIHLRTCAHNERVFMSLLSPTAYLNDVRLYPATPDLYEYFLKRRFSLVDEKGMFQDGAWLHPPRVIEHCTFNKNWFFDGFYVTAGERSIQGIIKTGFSNDLIC